MGFLQLRTLDSLDPWAKIEIDPATRRLAEHAAAAAGLSIEDWLERAIRRAGKSFTATTEAKPNTAAAADEQDYVFAAEALSPATDKPLVAAAETDNEASDEVAPPGFYATGFNRWALMAAGIVLAIVAGVVSAQYLIPDRSTAIHVALAPAKPADNSSQASDATNNATPESTTTRPDLGAPASPPAPAASVEPAPTAPGSTASLPPAPSASTASQTTPPASSGKTAPTPQDASSRKTIPAKPPAAAIATARTSPSTAS